MLSGGVASIQTPGGGYHIVGLNLDRPEALINIAGLESMMGISPVDTFSAWARDGNDWRDIRNFAGGNSRAREDFVYNLGITFRDNLAHINREFGVNLSPNTYTHMLPSEILEYVIYLYGSSNE